MAVRRSRPHGFALSILVLVAVEAFPCNPAAGEVALFVNADYRGDCVLLRPGDYGSAAAFRLPNDSISSVRVGGSVQAVVCSDANHDGDECERLTANDPNLGDNAIGNDRVSSVRVRPRDFIECAPAADQIALYKHAASVGPCIVRGPGHYPDAASLGVANDSVSSVRAGSSIMANLCQDAGFRNCTTVQPAGVAEAPSNDTLSSATVFAPPSFTLDRSAFSGRSNASSAVPGDLDRDGLLDDAENILALEFRPVIRFDKDEQHRRMNPREPLVVYQVRPANCAGRRCETSTLNVQWMFLFLRDGGYPDPKTWCALDDHIGDNDTASLELTSRDGLTWTLARVKPSDGSVDWPSGGGDGLGGGWLELRTEAGKSGARHPVIYMSRGKHHLYLHAGDVEDAAYSAYGCHDDNDGDGALVWPDLVAGRMHRNVGEPEIGDSAAFYTDFTALFPATECSRGRTAFSSEPFCVENGKSNSVVWFRNAFSLRP